MESWNKSLIVAIAIISVTAAAQAGMAGRSSGGVRVFHGGNRLHARSLGFRGHPYNFALAPHRLTFGRAESEGWGGGAYSAGVVGFDYDEGDDFAPENLHFRAQEPFGPGDIGRGPPPPAEPYDGAPWENSRIDPRQAPEPDGW